MSVPPPDNGDLPADPIGDPDDASQDDGGQLAIVKRQFQKNRAAVWGLRTAIALVHIAIFAPLIASGDPFVFRASGEETTYPWIAHLLDVISWEHSLDRAFNALMPATSSRHAR